MSKRVKPRSYGWLVSRFFEVSFHCFLLWLNELGHILEEGRIMNTKVFQKSAIKAYYCSSFLKYMHISKEFK